MPYERTGCGPYLFDGWRFLDEGREHAPWALAQYGFRVLIAPAFADIFFDNCFKNGLLPIVLEDAVINALFKEVAA